MKKVVYILTRDDNPPIVSTDKLIVAEKAKHYLIDVLLYNNVWLEDWYDYLSDMESSIHWDDYDWEVKKQDEDEIQLLGEWEAYNRTVKFYRRVLTFDEDPTDYIICA